MKRDESKQYYYRQFARKNGVEVTKRDLLFLYREHNLVILIVIYFDNDGKVSDIKDFNFSTDGGAV